jgi:hypothetical protein
MRAFRAMSTASAPTRREAAESCTAIKIQSNIALPKTTLGKAVVGAGPSGRDADARFSVWREPSIRGLAHLQ